ncbi:MAG: lycopene cyclase domain-containing protein [Gemmatimonadaceae bacterium]
MVKTSFATALLGLTEPIFVPAYWNPPSLFELARRTGFDVESIIFAFAVGGIGAVLYNSVTRRTFRPIGTMARAARRHRLHGAALVLPFVLFVPLYFLPWNPIYPGIVCLFIGAFASVACRPELLRKTIVGGALFLSLYAVFLLGLRRLTPGYIEQVWNLPALRGGLVGGIPLEELLFGLAFGMYWSGAYEHFAWRESVVATFATREH